MKIRKFLVGLIVSITAGLSALALSACEEETPKTNNPPSSEQGGGENAGGGNQSTEITITYDANGGAFDSGDNTFAQTVKANATLTAPTSPKRTNYTFAGWATDKNGGNMWTFDSDKPTESVTLYAIWKQQSGKILSVENATMNGDEIFMLVNHSTEVVSLSSKVVCSDDSTWKLYYDRLGQTEIPTKIAAGEFGELDDGDNIFYAVVTSQDGTQVNVYELNVYRSFAVDVKFYDGTELLKTETAYTGYEYTTNYTPNITGYTFNGWNYTPRVLWDSLNLYADTTANTYTITYDVNGGNALPTTEKTVTYDSSYTLAKPTRTGYTFMGWYLSSTQMTNANGGSLEAWDYANDKTLKAKWQANDYAVTLYKNNASAGTVTGAGDHAYDSNVTITASTNNGYTWLGWYDKDGTLVTTDYSYSFKMGFAVTYTAKWSKTTITRNNTSAGSVTSLTGKYKSNDQVTVTATTNSGYTFLGWYNGETKLTDELSYTFTMSAENVTYTAKWCKVTLSVSDTKAGSVSTLSGKYVFGEEVTVTAMTNDGYTFVGWYNGETPLTDELSYTFTMPAESVTYTAKWTYYTLTTTENISGGAYSMYSNKKISTGRETTLTASTYAGYIWLGWYDGKTPLTDELSYTFTMPAESVTYTAKWEVMEEMQNFNFTSTATTCSITGIKDKTVTEIVVPDYVTSISQGAFSGCSFLESITLPFAGEYVETGRYTYMYPFGHIFGTESYTNSTATEQSFPGGAGTTGRTYYIPTSLKSVIVTGGKILDSAFYNCRYITSITILESVTSIGSSAFHGCSSLTEIVIPNSVTSISVWAFRGCTNLTNVIFKNIEGWTASDAAYENWQNWDVSDSQANAEKCRADTFWAKRV